jgi:hypothetical protein
MELKLFAFVPLLILLTATAQDSSLPMIPPILIGYVTDASGTGIAGAGVRVENITTTSEEDGSYLLSLAGFKEGDAMRVTAVIGSQEFHQEVTVLSPDINVLNLSLPISAEEVKKEIRAHSTPAGSTTPAGLTPTTPTATTMSGSPAGSAPTPTATTYGSGQTTTVLLVSIVAIILCAAVLLYRRKKRPPDTEITQDYSEGNK